MQASILGEFAAWPVNMVSPAATPKRFSPSPSKKRSRVAAPNRTVFNSSHAPPLSPALRSELQTDRLFQWLHRSGKGQQTLSQEGSE
jgi:hypothetical protein